MFLNFDLNIRKIMSQCDVFNSVINADEKSKNSRNPFALGEAPEAKWGVETAKVVSIENEAGNKVFKVSAVVQNDFGDNLPFGNRKTWSGRASLDMVERLSKNGTSEPVFIVYVKPKDNSHNHLVNFFTEGEYNEYLKLALSVEKDLSDCESKYYSIDDEDDFTKSLYKKLVLFSCLDNSHKKIVRMRWGLDPLEIRDGAVVFNEDLSASSAENTIVAILCAPLIPEYVHKELEKNRKQSENKKLSETRRNIVEIRNMYYPALPFGLPYKKFTVKDGIAELDKTIYGRKNVKRRALQYIQAERRCYWDRTIPDIYKNRNERMPAILVIIGRSGSGKELIAQGVSKVSSYTYVQFDANSLGLDTQELLGSSTIYQNSELGALAKLLLLIGDNGSMIINNFGAANPNMKNAISGVMTRGVLRDNNLECNLDVSRMIFIITANDRSEIPNEILDRACVVNLNKMSDKERLVIGKQYMFPMICKDLYVNPDLIRFTDAQYEKLCNSYRFTSSLDQIHTNLKEVIQNISNEYIDELEAGNVIEVTDEYIEKCLFSGSYEHYIYDISELMNKYKKYRCKYSKEDQDKIEALFEEYEVSENDDKRGKIEDKLRFQANYVPLRRSRDITVDEILSSYKRIMDREEYGHDEAKQAIIDSMIENILAGKDIFGSLKLLLHGPAGTGKTMLAHMLSEILGIPFIKISLNGKKDSTTLKGHSTSYQSAQMGEPADKLAKCGSRGCVFLIDEGEKAGEDVINALFDITDPSEGGFYDDFLGDFIDTSQIIFIMTCNDISKLPRPLLDRFKVIPVEGYTKSEKIKIATDYVIPKYLKEFSLDGKINFRNDAVDTMITDYIQTSSVREIEKKVKKLIVGVYSERFKDGFNKKFTITNKIVKDILGAKPIKSGNIPIGDYTPGIMNCLAVGGDGSGCVFPVEIVLAPYMDERSITGSCKDMIKDSIKMADVLVSNILGRKLENTAITMAEQAIPKDGPSAGLSIVLCMLSAHLGLSLPKDIAATGEIDLQGNVFAIGGTKEKIDAARQEGVKKVYIPKQNYDFMKESGELTDYTDIDIVPVSHVTQAAEELFGEAIEWQKVRK